jgi:hypothetical protein
VRGIVTGAADEISLLEIEIIFFARATELWELRVKLIVSNSEAVFMPATNNELASRSRTQEHLLDDRTSNKIW